MYTYFVIFHVFQTSMFIKKTTEFAAFVCGTHDTHLDVRIRRRSELLAGFRAFGNNNANSHCNRIERQLINFLFLVDNEFRW